MRFLLCLHFIAIFISRGITQPLYTLPGTCPEFKKKFKEPLDIKKLEGTWYEYGRYRDHIFAKCASGNLTTTGNNTMNFTFRGFRTVQQFWQYVDGTISFAEEHRTVLVNTEATNGTDEAFEGISMFTWKPNPKYLTALDYNNYMVMFRYLELMPVTIRIPSEDENTPMPFENVKLRECDKLGRKLKITDEDVEDNDELTTKEIRASTLPIEHVVHVLMLTRRPLTDTPEDEVLKKLMHNEFNEYTAENENERIEYMDHRNCTNYPLTMITLKDLAILEEERLKYL